MSSCPFDYRYGRTVFARPAELHADTLYVIGGLYGNVQAIDAVFALSDAEPSGARLVFNGDFNWYNVDPETFESINRSVLEHVATRGNVETELAREGNLTDCGCAYPEWVDATTVERSNQIFARLKTTAARFPALQARLGALPMHLIAEVGDTRIAIVHGDAESLSGWSFSQEALRNLDSGISELFNSVRIFACTHTCLPVLKEIPLANGSGLIANNGAAGMPNFRGLRSGVLTRISTSPSPKTPLYGVRFRGLHVDAINVDYDHGAFVAKFLADWPAGSAAHLSYFNRIVDGPDYQLSDAIRVSGTITSPVQS